MSANDHPLLVRFRRLSTTRRAVLLASIAAFGLLLLGHLARSPFHSGILPGSSSLPKAVSSPATPYDDLKAEWQRLKEASRAIPGVDVPTPTAGAGGTVDGLGYATPLISHAAELAVATKEFSRSRSDLEEIPDRHHGYASKLRMIGQPSGSTLTATLRVPSSEFTATVSDLKMLGNVEREEQTADEVSQQEADLEARIANARNTLQRLQGFLQKEGNSAEIQRQLLAIGSEIARLETQRRAWQNRAIFANVLFSLREVLTPPVDSFGAQFRKAALAGLSDAVSSLSVIVLFAISYGPQILLWTLMILFPGRWLWRKWRTSVEPQAIRSEQST